MIRKIGLANKLRPNRTLWYVTISVPSILCKFLKTSPVQQCYKNFKTFFENNYIQVNPENLKNKDMNDATYKIKNGFQWFSFKPGCCDQLIFLKYDQLFIINTVSKYIHLWYN